MLEHEHRVIAQVVAAPAAFAEAIEVGQPPTADTLRNVVEFTWSYADRNHRGKEETYLFSLLTQRGVPVTGCPIGALTHEHEVGCRLVSDLDAAIDSYANGDRSASGSIVALLQSMAELYRSHIWKEDYLLFPMTNKVLGPEDQRVLLSQFEQVDAAIGADDLQRLTQMADELSSLAGESAHAAT